MLGLYAAVTVALGAVAARRQHDTNDFFLGGRTIPWPLIGVSILATAFSAASLLGGPGEAYQHGLLWLQLQLGDLIAILLVMFLFIPFYQALGTTTAYGYLERRFGLLTRSLAALLFQLQVLLRTGVLLYGPALALSAVTGMDVTAAILLVGVIAILYTLMGGMTAVVWTDALQLVVVTAGVLLTAVVVTRGITGGLAGALEIAGEAGRLKIIDPQQPLSSVRSLGGAVIGYGILSLAVAGTNQQPVQRYMSCGSVRDARRAAFTGWAVGLFVTVITLGLGVLLFAYYKVHFAELPNGIAPDAIFPHFVATELPAGLAGLVIAAIFAAAMSSLDSALHSLTTSTLIDGYRRLLAPDRDERHYLRVARLMMIGWGGLGIAAGLYVAGRGSLLAMAVRYVGYFAGPVLGLFVLGILTRRTNERGAVLGMTIAFVLVVLSVNAQSWFGVHSPIGGIWHTALGAGVTIVAGYALSGWGTPPTPEQLKGWTLQEPPAASEDFP